MMSQVDTKALHRLREWERKEGELPRLIQFYRELLKIQSEAKSRIVIKKKPGFSKELVRDWISQGIPLLLFEDLSPDWRQVQKVFEQVADWSSKDLKSPSDESRRLRKVGSDIPLLKELAREWYSGHSLQDLATANSIDCEMLTSVTAATLKPFLSAYAELLLPDVDKELWRRGYCPICGGKPDFAYLDKDAGSRWLLCSRCDAEWVFVRLQCPYCGTQQPDALTYFTDDKESYLYRLYVCEHCHTYIKAVDLRRTGSKVLLPLERVLTLDMDKQAQEKGYKPGWAAQ